MAGKSGDLEDMAGGSPAATELGRGGAPTTRTAARVIFAASLGTGFEWYDFFLYGSLASVISRQFFSTLNETSGFIFALLTFAAGFAVRPLGALVFGRLGDLIGRKKTFLTTIIVMGAATTLVGALPGYQSIGTAAPLLLICLRMLQGLAIGGEYGGAAIYVAEHAPGHLRGRYTSWIQTTATLALLLSLLIIMFCRRLLGPDFESWGWRIPFLVSALLLAVSVYVRLQLAESPVFQQMVAEGTRSTAPVRDAFSDRRNRRRILAVLLGATAGQNVIWYGSQLYALYFLTQVLKVDPQTASLLLASALLVCTPLYVVFGRLSDRLGRKRIVLSGLALAALTYFPIYRAITHYANPAIEAAARRSPVAVLAERRSCSLQLDPLGRHRFVKSCDIAKGALAKAGIPYGTEDLPSGSATVRIGRRGEQAVLVPSFEGEPLAGEAFRRQAQAFDHRLSAALRQAGYPASADPTRINPAMIVLLLSVLVTYATMATGPLAAWLVELFPARIRYTSLSIPYHIGAGWFGGFMPAVAFALVAITGNIYAGLWYPVLIAAGTVFAGTLLLPETAGRGAPTAD
jgi:MFS family permease